MKLNKFFSVVSVISVALVFLVCTGYVINAYKADYPIHYDSDTGTYEFLYDSNNFDLTGNRYFKLKSSGIASSNLGLFAVDPNGDDSYKITLTPAPTAYASGMIIIFDANTANTGACTVNVNELGAKSLKVMHNRDPNDNYIEAGSIVMAVYDGTNFQIQSPAANNESGQ